MGKIHVFDPRGKKQFSLKLPRNAHQANINLFQNGKAVTKLRIGLAPEGFEMTVVDDQSDTALQVSTGFSIPDDEDDDDE